MHVANLGGRAVGVSNEQVDDEFSIDKGRMVARVWTGSASDSAEANYITADTISPNPISASYFTDGDKLYFPAAIPFMGDQRIGIWSVDAAGTFAIDAVEPTIASSARIISCYRLGKAWFIARSDGNVYRANDQASFTATSVMETTIYGDRFNHSEFFGATVSFEPLLAGQSVTLKYRKAGTQAWSTLKTQSAVGAVQLQTLGSAAGVAPQLDEYQFRVESLGATITGLLWMTDANDRNIYS